MFTFSKLEFFRYRLKEINLASYALQSVDLKSSILLPKTDFPLWVKSADVVKRNRDIEKRAKFDELYEWQLNHKKGKLFILHDGPPYANGDVHIGHAVNKILKDITLRSKLLSGFRVHYVPGWDCHGLPIELKALKTNGSKSHMTDVELRKIAFNFSQNVKERQMSQFKKWGLLADWKNTYATCQTEYITKQWNLFFSLYEKKLVYQDYKPVFWSPSNRTSLAEAELEYNDKHVSKSVYIKFPILRCPEIITAKVGSSAKLYGLIWTTTPWTLPANQAICFSPNKRYSLVKTEKNEFFVVGKDLHSTIKDSLKTNLLPIEEFDGGLLNDFVYIHPLFGEKEFPFLPAPHVTMSKGTGLVHMAPNHGSEDYAAAKLHKISLSPCIVDEDGKFGIEAGDSLSGKEVLGSGTEKVLEIMKEFIVHSENYTHSYPYDWRSHKPVIIRSSHQWFINTEALKEQAEACLQQVELVPDIFRKAFLNQLKNCPPWCISRQRLWGVPIPVFYQTDNRNPVITQKIIDHLNQLLKTRGIHFWWELSTDQLLTSSLKQECNLPDKEYKKCPDIMDIWFDSGISWKAVLPEPNVSDVCIEGLDQIRGWFNSSLLTSVAYRGIAPYRKLLFHGFTTDGDGHKMSKSKGNVVNPEDITDGNQNQKPLGADILRWWVASHACQHENIPFKDSILEDCVKCIVKIRSVFKFLLGNIQDFDPVDHSVHPSHMKPIDLYMLHLSQQFMLKVEKSYEEMQYKNVCFEIVDFVANSLSSFYILVTKDRLYCDLKDSISRRSCLTVLSLLCEVLVCCLAPITPHLAEEVFHYHPKFKKGSVFRSEWEPLKNTLSCAVCPQPIVLATELRAAILKLEMKTVDKELLISGHDMLLEHLHLLQPEEESVNSDLCELFQVAKVKFGNSGDGSPNSVSVDGCIETPTVGCNMNYSLKLEPTCLEACPRCRRIVRKAEETLCKRCEEVI